MGGTYGHIENITGTLEKRNRSMMMPAEKVAHAIRVRQVILFGILLSVMTACGNFEPRQLDGCYLGQKGIHVGDVLANAKALDGCLLRVVGAAHIGFEQSELCDERTSSGGDSCVWVEYFPGAVEDEKDLSQFDRSYENWTKFDSQTVELEALFKVEENSLHQQVLYLRSIKGHAGEADFQ
ncbi:hypothetical protein C7S18_18915 [Ahniella affigens]|uniref:Uncharacterized protein n=1 Tax=Ahniella affigens TaxID=2021234 RepID=A0A2P1PW91_9GAMM|nr:hypothetical protein [Ahniella affigens]AVP99113.1 hypothetical protein C7S18_18915 [Ahniella affigens]